MYGHILGRQTNDRYKREIRTTYFIIDLRERYAYNKMKDFVHIVGGHKVKRETRIEKIFNQDYNAGKAFKTIV